MNINNKGMKKWQRDWLAWMRHEKYPTQIWTIDDEEVEEMKEKMIVSKVRVNSQKDGRIVMLVTVPKGSGFEKGDYVKLVKVKKVTHVVTVAKKIVKNIWVLDDATT